MTADSSLSERMERVIRKYIQTCNEADAPGIAACFMADANHYFTGIPKWSGATAIGAGFERVVTERGRRWTVDRILTDVSRCAAVLEWSQFDPPQRIVRGVDWFDFDRATLRIKEIRSYLAARPDPKAERQEMQSFDYAARGYPTAMSNR